MLLKINNVQFQGYILKYANLDPHIHPGHVSPRKVTVKSAQHFTRLNTKKKVNEPTPVFLQIVVREKVLTSSTSLILFKKKMIESLLHIRLC